MNAVVVTVIAGVVLGLAMGAGRAQQQDSAGTLVCVGDSITEGQPKDQVGEGKDYVSLLGGKAAKLGMKVKNEGRSGWATMDYIKNAQGMVDSMPADAAVVTILLGTNDTRFGEDGGEIANRAVANLRKLIALYQAKAPKARFVIMAAPAIYPDMLPENLRAANYNERSPAKVEALRDAYKAMAREDHLQFIDLSDLPSRENSIEGVHPNAAGQQQLAEKIWAELGLGSPR
jgi:lysophospholipase L1-like esterase